MAARFEKCLFRILVTIVAFLCVAPPLFADSASITKGIVHLPWDGSRWGFAVAGPDTRVGADFTGSATTTWAAGQTADLSATVNVLDATHLRTVTIKGVTYSNVFIKGTLTFRANPFVVPPQPPTGTFNRLAAEFTMSGTIEGYSDSSFTTRIFSAAIQGAGVADFGFSRYIPESNTYCACGGGGTTYTFTGPEPSAWTSTDVGSVGLPGNDGVTAVGAVEVGGAGSDIWGSTDAFRFVATPLPSDGALVARVVNQQNTNPFAKAGIMLRQSLSADAPHVTIDVKPDHSIELLMRSQSGGVTEYLGGAMAESDAVWLMLSRTGDRRVTASVSDNGWDWIIVGSGTLAGEAYVGLAVTSHDNAALNQATFDRLSGGALTPSLPRTWTYRDVGNVGQSGTGSGAQGTFTISGAGADIWGTADSFAYVYQPFTGDGEIRGQVTAVENTSPFAKAGFMLRESTDPSAVSVVLDVKPDGGVEFMVRDGDSGQTSFIAGTNVTFPVTLSLARFGTKVLARVFSANGLWSQGIDLPSLPADALLGMAVVSHDTSRLNTATFEVVETSVELAVNGGFELSTLPATGPVWVSDTPTRQADAASATSQPHSGLLHGECVTQTARDCGLYQDITLYETGRYNVQVWANSDVAGAYVGINAPGIASGVLSTPVRVGGFGNYSMFRVGFDGKAGDVVRVWLYAPASPGTTVIDDLNVRRYFGE